MSWRGIEGGIAAANAGHDVVMTPTSHCYFDYRQAATGEPRAIGAVHIAQDGLWLRADSACADPGQSQAHPRRRRQSLERAVSQLCLPPVHGLSAGLRDGRSDLVRSETEEVGMTSVVGCKCI